MSHSLRDTVAKEDQPKAGQGMNTAFHDALNLAWKIHHVESGFAKRSILDTYELERKHIAEELLSFDSKYAALFSQRQPSASEVGAASEHSEDGGAKNEFVEVFKASTEFTTGYGIAYEPNVFNWSPNHPAQSGLFNPKSSRLRTGRIMPTANVTRVADANNVQLEQEIPLNGSFRIFLFAGVPSITRRALFDFAENLGNNESFYSVFQRPDMKSVSDHERHNPHSQFFTICTTFTAPRDDLEITEILPRLLCRYNDHVYADDLWDPRVPNAKASAHAKMGLDPERGGVVIVRPDGHVGCVVALSEGSGTVDALNEYFAAFTPRTIGKQGLQPRL